MREDGTIVLVDEGALNPRVYLGSEPEAWAVEDFFRIEDQRFQYYTREQERTEGKPKAREQKASEVLGRYKFRPGGSLIGGARLANELRGYMIVDERGRKVKAADVIAKDISDTKKRVAEGERQDEQRAELSLEQMVAKEARDIELKALRDEFIDFRQQKGQLGAATEGLSTAAVVQFAKERGFSDKAILAIRPGAQQAIDKYDERAARVNREIQGIIQRTRERARGDKDIQAIENKARRTRAVNDRIEEDVLAYLKGTKFYKDASDVGREAMVRAVRKQMGRRMKSAPSVIKLGIDNGIPTIDKRDLNRQIRMIAESSRQTAHHRQAGYAHPKEAGRNRPAQPRAGGEVHRLRRSRLCQCRIRAGGEAPQRPP
jgi:hypothetical protein